ncbi:MAG: histidine phosphatase family protein [Chloroflexaceae bacterium]|nr:histidine phosphatase family protein [Chloroflexaceae bacterium]
MTRLYLIRHGEAESNVTPIMGGMRGDTGLTARGRQQAQRLHDRLASGEIAVDVLIASTLPRARQTAEIIAPALKLEPHLTDDIQELRIGEADGMNIQDAWAQFGTPDFDRYPLRPIAPGGESWGQFMLRVGTALQRITEEHAGKAIMLVCHGGFIDGSFVYFFELPSLSLPKSGFYTHNTSITSWQQTRYDQSLRWRLVGYNDIAHLYGMDLYESLPWTSTKTDDAEHDDHPSVPLPTERSE